MDNAQPNGLLGYIKQMGIKPFPPTTGYTQKDFDELIEQIKKSPVNKQILGDYIPAPSVNPALLADGNYFDSQQPG